jgi:hypothetical protein
MNYLQLTQKAVRLSGARLDPPTSVTSAKGLSKDFATYVNDAWRDIQLERPEWYFRVQEVEIGLSDSILEKGQQLSRFSIPSPINRSFNFVALYDFQIQERDNKADPPTTITYIPWNNYPYHTSLDLDYNEATQEANRPKQFTVSPDGQLWVYPKPDKDYTLRFFGIRRIQELCADCDEPFMPPEYQDMIVWRAIRDYATYMQDPAMMEKARMRYLPLKKSMDDEYLPHMTNRVDNLYSQ